MRSEASAAATGDPDAFRLAAKNKRIEGRRARAERRVNIAGGYGNEKTSRVGNFFRKASGGTVAGESSKVGKLLSSPFKAVGSLFRKG